MSGTRVKRLILLISILLPFLITATPLCHADNFPDISTLDRSYVLKDNRQFFIKDSGYVLVSTDSIKETFVTLLDGSGNPDKSAPVIATSIPFAYEQAVQAGDFLYLAGKAPDLDSRVEIARFRITDCSLIQNEIEGVSCDFTRGFRVETDGSFYLVTVPYGTEINPLSPFREYAFDPEHEGAHCTEKPVSGSDSASSAESNPSSSSEPEEASSSPSSEPESRSSGTESGSMDARVYVFPEAMTVETLQKQLDSEGRGAVVRVTDSDGTAVKSGNVGTGSTVEVMLNGQAESRVTAVIPGDLTGSGEVTERDDVLLYEHITNQRQLTGLFFQAADINGDEKIDTSDMLRIKKLMK